MNLRHLTFALVVVFLSGVGAVRAEGDAALALPSTTERDKAQKQEKKEQERAAKNSGVAIVGATAFKDDVLLSQLKEQIASIDQLGLTAARGDDAAFFLELFYRKHGYEKAEVRYSISGSHLRLEVNEGPRVTVGNVNFVGNENLATDKLFDFVIGPTRERYGKTEKTLPYVKVDLEEGVDLARRLYISEGYLNAIVQAPNYSFKADGTQVDLNIAIVEGRRYSFGEVRFAGREVYPAETLRKEIADILAEPYTDRRVNDIPRRLQAYFKARGYYDVKVEAVAKCPFVSPFRPGRFITSMVPP